MALTGSRLQGAAASIIVLMLVLGVATPTPERAALESTGRGDRPPTGAAQVDTFVPMFLDFVAPVNGDALEAASRKFRVGAVRAKARTIAACVRERGYPGAERFMVTEAQEEVQLSSGNLPSMASILRMGSSGMTPATHPDRSRESDEAYGARMQCAEDSRSAPSIWLDTVEHLQARFLHSQLLNGFAAAEASPVWTEAQQCMTEAGAPADGPDAVENPAPDQPVDNDVRSPGFEGYYEWFHDEASAQAFVRCLTPFFAELERVLAGPRAEFVAEHHNELLQLQRRYEAFAADGN